jgi:hypothetical protein
MLYLMFVRLAGWMALLVLRQEVAVLRLVRWRWTYPAAAAVRRSTPSSWR